MEPLASLPAPEVSKMIVDSPNLTPFEKLPTEILQAVAGLLPLWKVRDLSCASKRVRQACLPSLFRCVKFEFSQAGIEGLEGLLKSDARRHVASFTYAVPELLKAGEYFQ